MGLGHKIDTALLIGTPSRWPMRGLKAMEHPSTGGATPPTLLRERRLLAVRVPPSGERPLGFEPARPRGWDSPQAGTETQRLLSGAVRYAKVYPSSFLVFMED